MSHTITVGVIDFSFNFATEVISIDALTEKLDADSIQEASRGIEASEEGIVFPQIINTSGKVTLDAESETGLNVILRNNWKILTLKNSGLFTVGGGNVVSDVNGVAIFAANPLVDAQNNTSQAGVRVLSGDGSGECDFTEIMAALDIINKGIQNSSLIIPHTVDLADANPLTVDSDTITVDSDIYTADQTRL